MSVTTSQLVERIKQLKKERNAVILAHYYTTPDVQEIADFLGDSLALSIKAKDTDADVILFAGVHFMAETAKVLSPEKTVLIPCLEAGCSLADSCKAEDLAKLKAEHPDHVVVSYVNTTVDVKALTDICCTSSNALKVVESIPREQPIIFAPDRNLGSYIKRLTKRDNMILWDGACHVHEDFSVDKLLAMKAKHPNAKVLAHPECKEELIQHADYVGATSGILNYCGTSDAEEFLVVTESGIISEMVRKYPKKRFIPALPGNSNCCCNECNYMKMVTLENICQSLETMSPEVTIDEEVRKKAERSILNMIAIK